MKMSVNGQCGRAGAWCEEMADQELDEILTLRWPDVLRRVKADGSDEWLLGFVRSIARQGKRQSWRPSPKQAQIMRRLVSELRTAPEPKMEVIER